MIHVETWCMSVPALSEGDSGRRMHDRPDVGGIGHLYLYGSYEQKHVWHRWAVDRGQRLEDVCIDNCVVVVVYIW